MEQAHGLALFAVQSRLALANPLQTELVGLLIALGTRSPDRRSLLGVQHPKLKPAEVGGLAHLSTQSVDFSGEVALGKPANRRIAGHLSDGIQIDGQ
jgi:hypothetical protein